MAQINSDQFENISMNKTQFLLPLFLFTSLATASQLKPEITETEVAQSEVYRLVDQRQLDLPYFQKAIKQNDISLTILALQGLGRIGGNQVLPSIYPSLTDNRKSVRVAAVFALGISGSKQPNERLWSQLNNEKSERVKQEIYLALGNIGGPNLISKLLERNQKEKHQKTKSTIFQALAIAITYHPSIADNIDMKRSQSLIDFSEILSLLENDDQVSYQAGYFLARIKNIDKRISPAQLQKFTKILQRTNNKKIFARLIGKITKKKHLANRRLLSWLIEQSELPDVALATEAIRAMATMIYIPQAKIQLGKLQASSKLLIAQTALKVLSESELSGREITALLKKQLKSDYPGLVVEAMSGLMKRQDREDMTWALKILSHKNTFVKINFARMIFEKDRQGFKNVLSMLTKDSNNKVSTYAKKLLNAPEKEQSSNRLESPDYQQAQRSAGKVVRIKTTAGIIDIKLNGQAIYTAANFIRLVKSGYFNNSYFSRVIGNFVAQGGDPIGDGQGSSGQTIREELSYLSHEVGTVGMATAGKDTGDSQFFINTSDNTHLDRKYTIFGTVVKGLEVALELSNGDQIVSASILEK